MQLSALVSPCPWEVCEVGMPRGGCVLGRVLLADMRCWVVWKHGTHTGSLHLRLNQKGAMGCEQVVGDQKGMFLGKRELG